MQYEAPQVECFTGEHLRMLPFAVICATLYSVGLVVGFWALLYYHRDELSDLAVKQRYGAAVMSEVLEEQAMLQKVQSRLASRRNGR